MFEPLDVPHIARLEEGRIATSVAEIAPEARPWLGGMLCRGKPALWYNGAYGAALDLDATDRDVEQLIAFFEERAIEPRLELASLASPATLAALARAGFILGAVEEVLALPLGRDHTPDAPLPDGITIEPVDPDNPDTVEAFAGLSMRGFLPPNTPPSEDMLAVWRSVARHPRSRSFIARVAGEPAAAASVETLDRVACLFGATTLEPFRARGIQSALISHRLRTARDLGATIATIGSKPGHHTARNAMRHGFQIAYAKAVLVRPAPGLTPAMG